MKTKRIVPKVIYCLHYCFLLTNDSMHNEYGLCGNFALKSFESCSSLTRILYNKVWYNITLWYTQQWLFMIIISGSAVSFHTHLLNSSLISSTLDGWQQMAQEDWAGSNNGAIYLCPTRIRSSNDTWGILFNRFLQKNKTITSGQLISEAWYAWAMGCTAQVYFLRQLCKLADFKQPKNPKWMQYYYKSKIRVPANFSSVPEHNLTLHLRKSDI